MNKKLSFRSDKTEDAAACKKIIFESLTHIAGTVAKGWSAKRLFTLRSTTRSKSENAKFSVKSRRRRALENSAVQNAKGGGGGGGGRTEEGAQNP
jgi:hypothetical protein